MAGGRALAQQEEALGTVPEPQKTRTGEVSPADSAVLGSRTSQPSARGSSTFPVVPARAGPCASWPAAGAVTWAGGVWGPVKTEFWLDTYLPPMSLALHRPHWPFLGDQADLGMGSNKWSSAPPFTAQAVAQQLQLVPEGLGFPQPGASRALAASACLGNCCEESGAALRVMLASALW